MKKLFKLKEWLTLEETARRLTLSLQEEVSVADVLQLSLDEHITVSVLIEESKFVIQTKKIENSLKEILGINDDFSEEFMRVLEASESLHGGNMSKIYKETYSESFFDIEAFGDVFYLPLGIYDLPMIGAEKLDVLHLCSQYQGRNPAELINIYP